jgi:hypothetical protein
MGKDHERGSRPGRRRMIANDVISMRIWKHNMEVEKGGRRKTRHSYTCKTPGKAIDNETRSTHDPSVPSIRRIWRIGFLICSVRDQVHTCQFI